MRQYRFRCPIYVDFFIQEEDFDSSKEVAQQQVDDLVENIPNSYPGELMFKNGATWEVIK